MEVNLLPNVAKFQADKVNFSRKMVGVTMTIGTVWVLVLAVVMAFYWISRINFSKTESKHKALLADYLSMSEGVVVNQNLRYKLKLVNQVLSQRFEYGRAFRQMESLFGEEVKLSSLELKDDKSFSFSGEVVNGELMDMVERKIIDINEGRVEGFFGSRISSVENEGDLWKFDLEVDLK